MSQSPANNNNDKRIWIAMAVGIVITIVLGIVMVRYVLQDSSDPGDGSAGGGSARAGEWVAGVEAVIRAGDVSRARVLPAAAFTLAKGQSLDMAIPPGPFECEIFAKFDPRGTTAALIGAEIQGGSLTVTVRDKPILEVRADPTARTVMSKLPVDLLPDRATIKYVFKSDGEGAARFRALWQPDETYIARPLPSQDDSYVATSSISGLTTARRFNCASCHAPSSLELAAELGGYSAPLLGDVGRRVKPAWMRDWLADPQSMKPGVSMPDLFHGDGADTETIEDLVHFLVSRGGPMAASQSLDENLVNTGKMLYHRLGCVACHGPQDGSGAGASLAFAPLGKLAEKTSTQELAAFLGDPLAIRPSGHMPDQQLTDLEARSIASFLIANTQNGAAASDAPFVLDPIRAQRGQEHFAALGCADCHEFGPNGPDIESTLAASPLESAMATLADDAAAGCLSADHAAGTPNFTLTGGERSDVATYLGRQTSRRAWDVPHDRLAATVEEYRCLSCHSLHGTGGPPLAIDSYFAATNEADMGDEGRLPPDLTGVGAKLNPLWFAQVMAGEGRIRPYMASRMPVYGDDAVGDVHELFRSIAGAASGPDDGPLSSTEHVTAGRALVGRGRSGMDCINCHSIAGQPSNGIPGPDLAYMPERLRYDFFARWMHDPKVIRPQTRMLPYFFGGRSAQVDLFEGLVDPQIDAIWSYLSLGSNMPLPEGITDPLGMQIDVADQPFVWNGYSKEAGVRTVACGFPNQVHCAYDADSEPDPDGRSSKARFNLSMIWSGQFLNASGAWAGRGGLNTDPKGVIWTSDGLPMFHLGLFDADEIDDADESQQWYQQPQLSYRGYSFEDEGPALKYDLELKDYEVNVVERPRPMPNTAGGGEPFYLLRRITLTGRADTVVAIHLSEGQTLSNPGPWEELTNGWLRTVLTDDAFEFDVEVRW